MTKTNPTPRFVMRYSFDHVNFDASGLYREGDEFDFRQANSRGIIHNNASGTDWKLRGVVYSTGKGYEKKSIEIPYAACRKMRLPLEIKVIVEGGGRKVK